MAKITLKNVRLSFPRIWTASQYQGKGDFTYEASFLIDPKSEAAALVKKTYKEVADTAWGAKSDQMLQQFKGNLQKTFLYDGALKPELEGYAGNLIVKAKRKQNAGRPEIRDRDGKTPLVEADGRPYGGCFVHAIVDVWPQVKGINNGMRCQLLGLQFVKDGDAFSGAKPPSDDDFEDLSDGADAPDVGAAEEVGGFV